MSWQAVQAVMDRSRSKGSERMLLMVIATHAPSEKLSAFVSVEDLCREANMGERNLHYTIAKLKGSGELEVEAGGGRGRANTYTLLLGKGAEACTDSDNQTVQPIAPMETEKGAIHGDKGCNPASERVQSVVETVQPIAPHPREQEEPEEPKAKDRGSHREKARRSPGPPDDEFLDSLQAKPAYSALDVRHVFAKMAVWCEAKGKQPTRMRLINWLNREDQPMQGNGNGKSGQHRSGESPNLRRHRENYEHFVGRRAS